MDENDFSAGWKNQIGLAGEPRVMQPEAVSHAVYQTANPQLGDGVPRAYTRHTLASLRPAQGIHVAKYRRSLTSPS